MNRPSEVMQNEGFTSCIHHIFHRSASTFQNRFEIFVLELREEKARVVELLLWTAVAVFLSIMAFIVITAAILLFFSPDDRLYAAAGISLMYFALFAVAISQFNKRSKQFSQYHRQCLESLK